LAGSATSFQNQLAGLDRVLDLLEEPNELSLDIDVQVIDTKNVAGDISFSGLGFHYPNSQQMVLSDISLEVPAGTTCALVGRSGAGKTTLCNLVARFYDPIVGTVALDGMDLRRIQLDSYRSLLGIVEQDVFLFDGTIADNIAYAVSSCDQQDVEQAARSANAHEFIVGLEHGYETIIGERGVKLSGGQRQRLAIARAILAVAKVAKTFGESRDRPKLLTSSATLKLSCNAALVGNSTLLSIRRSAVALVSRYISIGCSAWHGIASGGPLCRARRFGL